MYAKKSTFMKFVSLDSAIRVSCIAFAIGWLLPYRTYPYASFYNDYVCIVGLLIGLLLLCGRDGIKFINLPASCVLPVGIAVYIAFQAAFGQVIYISDAILAVGYLIAAAGAAALGANYRNASPQESREIAAVEIFAIALVAGASLCAFITLFQFFNVDGLLGDWSVPISTNGGATMRPYANLGQPNQLALILCWALAGLWLVSQRDWLASWIRGALAVLLLTSLALTQSKIAWLLLPVLIAFVLWSQQGARARRVPPTTLILLLMYFVGLVLALPHLGQLSGTLPETLDQRMATNGVRSVMILQGIFLGLQHPLVGIGWMQFSSYQIEMAPFYAETQYATNSHNLIANLSAELGWVATMLILAGTVYWVFSRLIRPSFTTARIFALMLFTMVGIHSMVEFPLWYAYILLPVFFLAGLVEPLAINHVRSRIGRSVAIGALLVCSVAVALIGSDYRRVVQSFRALGLQLVGWDYPEGSIERPGFTMFTEFYDYIEFSKVRPTVGIAEDDIERYQRVANRFGYAPVLQRMAIIQALNGRQDDSFKTIMALRNLYRPKYAEAYQAWAQMAEEYPTVLGVVYKRLPLPDRDSPVIALPATPPTSHPASPPTPRQ